MDCRHGTRHNKLTVSLLKKLPPQAFENDSFPDWEERKKHYSPEFLEWLDRFTAENMAIVAWAQRGQRREYTKNRLKNPTKSIGLAERVEFEPTVQLPSPLTGR